MPDILIDGARDHIEIEALRLPRALIHIKPEALGTRISEPLIDGEAIAAGLGAFLALPVAKELVIEAFRLLRAEDAADMARQAHRVDQVLPRHLIIDSERRPAHGPVGLPLQFAMAAGDGNVCELPGLRLLVEAGACGQ